MLKRPDWFKKGFDVRYLTYKDFLNKFIKSLKKDVFYLDLGVEEHTITSYYIHISNSNTRTEDLLVLRMNNEKDFIFLFEINEKYKARVYVRNGVITKQTLILV